MAVICSSDKLYETCVAEVAPALKQAGARVVILAGHPGEQREAWSAAGVDRFVHIGCDVLGMLQTLLQEQGVIA
jgi:methylmalonyl-CoA mutase